MNAETIAALNANKPPPQSPGNTPLKAANARVAELEKLLGEPPSEPFSTTLTARQRIMQLEARIDVLNAMGKPPAAPAVAEAQSERPSALAHLHGRDRFIAAAVKSVPVRPASTPSGLSGQELFASAIRVSEASPQIISAAPAAAAVAGQPELTGRARFLAARRIVKK